MALTSPASRPDRRTASPVEQQKIIVEQDTGAKVSGALQLAGASGNEVCNPSRYGQIRRNPTTGTYQICKSTIGTPAEGHLARS